MPFQLREKTKFLYDAEAQATIERLVQVIRDQERARIVLAVEAGEPVPVLDRLIVAAQERAVECAFGYCKLPLADQLRIDRVARQRADLRGV